MAEGPRSTGRRVCVPGEGPTPCDILGYGEAPGAKEEEESRPFVGPAGKELTILLSRAGLTRGEDIYISNPVRCRPPANRDPRKEEVEACRVYTLQELQEVNPKVIVAFGLSAIKALTGKSEVGRNRGKLLELLPVYRAEVPVVATYHPAAFLHNPSNRETFSKAIVEDLKLAQRVIAEEEGVEENIAYLDDARVTKAFRDLASCDRLYCDLEWEVIPETRTTPDGKWPWSMRNGRSPRIVSISFAGRVDGEVLACGVPLPSEKYGAFIGKLLKNVPMVFHHSMADLIWLYWLGYIVNLSGDTLILASLLNLDTSLSLESLASLLTKMPPSWKKEPGDLVGKRPTTTEEWERLLRYNARDCIATLLLEEELLRMLRERGRESVLPLYNEILLPSVKVLARTALSGAPINKEKLERVRENAHKKISTLVEQVGRELDLPSNSYEKIINGPNLGEYVERATGITLPRTQKTNVPSAKNDNLLLHVGKHPVITSMLSLSKIRKFESGYLKPWSILLKLQRGDPVLHTVYRLTIVRTGRTSAEGDIGYTFQQWPRQAAVRSLVEAREHWGILSADESQIELRMAAWLANEKTMIRFFNEGRDLHMMTAGWIKALNSGISLEQYMDELEKWTSQVTKQERYGAKPFNFGLLFGGGPQVVVDTARKNYGIEISLERAKVGRDGYFKLYPGLLPWHESCWRFVRQGYSESEFGRRRDLLGLENEDEQGKLRKAINTNPQGDASDLSLFCMVYSDELFQKEYGEHYEDNVQVIGFFHDAEIAHYRLSEEATIKQIITEAFEHPPLERLGIELPVPLKVDIEVGKTWK